MNTLRYILANIMGILFCLLPFPVRTGLITIGDPDPDSPVILTCNYRMTVERVKRAIQGLDCYLLVANSRGVNVWCSSTGGLFTNHDVISVLKTSGIENKVNHRNVILPQLAATGIEAGVIRKKTGWKVIWGPVYAKEIPGFINTGFNKTPEMRRIAFPLKQRLEVATGWAFSISIILVLVMIPFWRDLMVPVLLLLWGLTFSIYLAFPLYSRRLSRGRRIGSIFLDYGQVELQLVTWGIVLLGFAGYNLVSGEPAIGFILNWGLTSAFIVFLITFDLMGTTPTYKASLHDDVFLRVYLDEEKCKGAGFCEQVCPRDCYVVDRTQHTATMPGAARCVKCGACIVQCPFDALYFKHPDGEIIPPEVTRKFKVNLMGKRLVSVEGK